MQLKTRPLSRFLFLFCIFMIMSGSSVATFAASLQLIKAPSLVKLGESIQVEVTYQDAESNSVVQVQLLGEDGEWFGGRDMQLQESKGTLQMPLRVEIPLGYAGEIHLMASLYNAEGKMVANVQRSKITVSPEPSYAVGPLCAPSQVARGEAFTINAWYTLRKARPVDIHIDVLNAQTKEWYAGAMISMKDQQGQVSGTLTLPQRAEGKLLWKIYVTPRGESFPNYLAESGLLIPMGDKTSDDCSRLENIGHTPPLSTVDFIQFSKKPGSIHLGQSAFFELNFDLVTQEKADLTVNFLSAKTQQYYGGKKIAITRAQHDARLEVEVPPNIQGPFYVIAFITPVGGTWDNSLAEDRLYTLTLDMSH